MSGAVVLGLLWAVGGVFLGTRWWRVREADAPAGVGGAVLTDGGRARFGSALEDGSPRRLQAMRLAYAGGALGVGLGLASGVAVLLALGAALLNLGTIYRYLVVALDHEGLDLPVLERPRLLVDAQARPA